MIERPSWQDIYGGPLPQGLPSVPRVDYPYVPEPACPEHCSGRHDHDGDVLCESCRIPAYEVWMHEWKGRPGINFSTLKPVNGMPPYRNGLMTNVACPACGKRMLRNG